MSDSPSIPHGAKRVLGQSQPGDRYFDGETKRWKKLKPRWPVIGEDELIIRRADVTQLPIPRTEDQPADIDEMEIPEIYVLEDEEAGFVLMARSHNQSVPAGPRLFHSLPKDFPMMEFVHATRERADRDAAILRDHIDKFWQKKTSKKDQRREGA